MNILFNLIPIRSGGGMQVAANFLEIIIDNNGLGNTWLILVSEGSEIERLLQKKNFKRFYAVPSNFIKRSWFEFFEVPKIIAKHNIDIVYSYGPGLPKQRIPSVTRSAYSNLYFPEINFWGNWNFVNRWKFRLKDKFRLSRTLNADGLVFENKKMQERAISLFGYSKHNTLFIYPSVSAFNQKEISTDSLPQKYLTLRNNTYNLLMLTSWHRNKNIDIVPDILKAYLDKYNDNSIRFIITVDPKHPYSIQLMARAMAMGVAENIILFGRVPVTEVRNIYKATDAVLLLSLLECFSSNIIESWTYKRPLIISDEEWSNAICEDATLYVPRDDSSAIADAIANLKNDPSLADQFIAKGIEQLKKYNTPIAKVKKQLDFLEKIYNQYASQTS